MKNAPKTVLHTTSVQPSLQNVSQKTTILTGTSPVSLSHLSLSSLTDTSTSSLSNRCLYELCQKYGKLALLYRRKFIGLLPEVSRRRLYEQKGFGSIFEFAYKLAGLSEAQVKRTLSLDKKFEDKPVLREALVSGKVSINKLARVASIATVENQKSLLHQTELLSQKAVETFVRDINHEFVRAHKIEDLKLSDEVITKLCEIQNRGLDVNEVILNFLREREEKIARTKEILAREQENKLMIAREQKEKVSQTDLMQTSQDCGKNKSSGNKRKSPPRYIPAKIRQIITEEHGTKCAIPHCPKPARTIHHTARFALSQNHNPHFLAPLCQEHHIIAHSMDAAFMRKRQR